jgi:hypothetical protein
MGVEKRLLGMPGLLSPNERAFDDPEQKVVL